MATIRDLAEDALRELGVLAGSESAPYADAAAALRSLNRMVDQWKVEDLMVPTVVRTVWPVTANKAQYEVGLDGRRAELTQDGFDDTWTNNTPPLWTKTLTGSGAVTEDTVNYQAGGSSLKMVAGASGSITLTRDFSARCGDQWKLSIYEMMDVVDAGVYRLRVYNPDTANYLTSSGTWSSTAQSVKTAASASFTLFTLYFTVETVTTVTDPNTTLRIIFTAENSAQTARWDTLEFGPVGVSPIGIQRPVRIEQVNLIDTSASPDFERPLSPLDDDGWANVRTKALTAAEPSAWHYNPTHPNGTLTLFPVPTDSDLKLALYVQTPVATFSSLSTDVSVPPGYERMIVKNLAVELAPSYGRPVSRELAMQAADAKSAVKRSNCRPGELGFEASALFGNRGGYDIRLG